MNLIEKKLFIDTPLQICAFNYNTGVFKEDLIQYWWKINPKITIPNDIEESFQKHLKYYYNLYFRFKSKLDKNKKSLEIIFTQLYLKKCFLHIEYDMTFLNFYNIVCEKFKLLNFEIDYERNINEFKDEFLYIKKNFDRLKSIEDDLDNILLKLLLILEIRDENIIDEILFRCNNKKELSNSIKKNDSTVSGVSKIINHDEVSIEQYDKQIKYLTKINNELTKKYQNERNLCIKELMENLDDEDLGFPLGNLYKLVKNNGKDYKKYQGYLNNLFIGLEKYGIMATDYNKIDKKINIKIEDICKNYRIDQDISKTTNKNGKYDLPGWEFNENKIILPLVKLEKKGVDENE